MDKIKDNTKVSEGISIKLKKEFVIQLRRLAANHELKTGENCSVSELIRISVQEYLERNPLK